MQSPAVSAFIVSLARPTAAYPWALSNYDRVREVARANRDEAVKLANSPDDADVLLFVESRCRFQTDVIRSSLYQRHHKKSVVLCFLDRPIPVVRGLYVGADSRAATPQPVGGLHYLRVADNEWLSRSDLRTENPEWLYSFKGRVENAPSVRGPLIALRDSRAQLINAHSGQSETDESYVRSLTNSKFVLCPRGIGLSSWRLYETIRAGRVPVVVADGWTKPKGIDWESFAVIVAESEISKIPDRLRALEPEWEMRRQLAIAAWNNHFAREVAFAWLCKQAHQLLHLPTDRNQKCNLTDQMASIAGKRDAVDLVKSYLREYGFRDQ